MIERDELSTLKAFLKKKLNFDLCQYKDSYIERRVKTRINLTNSSNLAEYIKLLRTDRDELNNLMDALTVNVTDFFRNTETFEVLEHDIIPAIIRNKENDSRDIIKVWSAGCSSGEEAYTLAILFLEGLEKSVADYKLVIHGTDIDRESLMKAKIGSYEERSIRGIRKDLLLKYFEQNGSSYKIKPEVGEHMKFSRLDLSSDIEKKLTTYELIVCRNVIIYFREDMKRDLFMKFHNMLRKDGYLLLGKNESVAGEAVDCLKNVNISERIYQKIKPPD